MDTAKLARMQAIAAQNRTGGKGTPRRKVPKKGGGVAGAGDDKKLGAALKKLDIQSIQGIEEVNMFKEDGNVIHFGTPKVQADVSSNTFAITGPAEEKELTELVPGILSQLGPESLASLRKLAESYQAMSGGAGGKGVQSAGDAEADDDIPDLVEGGDFESAAEKKSVAVPSADAEKLDEIN